MRSSRGSRTRALLATLGRLAAHALVAALCLEVAARLDDRLSYGAPFWGRYDADLLRAPDDEGLPRNVPGARFEKWRINALGFRGPPVDVAAARGRRIACVGTSESFGLYERADGEWPARLGRLVAERDRSGAEVVNASVVGLNRGSRLRYIDKYVAPLHPDVVVLYLNVLSEATYHAPAEPRARGGAAVPTLPASRVYPKLHRWVRQLLPGSLWRRYRIWSTARALKREEAAALGGRAPSDVLSADSVSRFDAHLRELVADLRARRIAPVLATYPTLGSTANRDRYRLELLDERVWHLELSEAGMVDAAARLNDVVRRVAAELGVPVADADVAVPKDGEHFADYVHYTDAGAERVAEAVLDALERADLLAPEASRTLTTVKTVQRAR